MKQVRLDCDGDTLLVAVDQEGPACHTGDRTCFDARELPLTVGTDGTEAECVTAASAPPSWSVSPRRR